MIQDLGTMFEQENIIIYIDSSGGEVKNRQPVKVGIVNGNPQVLEKPGDPRDVDDPLKFNFIFPNGYQQYCNFFKHIAERRKTMDN